MSINFFKDCCKTSSNKEVFGLYDEPAPSKSKAYIKESEEDTWIAIVNNKKKSNIDFYGIDHCVILKDKNGDDLEKCDGILKADMRLVFVELKNRKSSGWLKKGIAQIESTLNEFLTLHDASTYANISAYVCNKKRPRGASSSHIEKIQKFRDKNGGIRLYPKQIINL